MCIQPQGSWDFCGYDPVTISVLVFCLYYCTMWWAAKYLNTVVTVKLKTFPTQADWFYLDAVLNVRFVQSAFCFQEMHFSSSLCPSVAYWQHTSLLYCYNVFYLHFLADIYKYWKWSNIALDNLEVWDTQ